MALLLRHVKTNPQCFEAAAPPLVFWDWISQGPKTNETFLWLVDGFACTQVFHICAREQTNNKMATKDVLFNYLLQEFL